MKPKYLILLVALFLPLACGTTPPELYQASVVQDQALEAVAAGRETVIRAYDKELRDAYYEQLNLIEAAAIAQSRVQQADGSWVVPQGVVETISAQKAEQRGKIDVMLDAKLEEFLHDDNLEIARELNTSVKAWLKLYVGELAQRVDMLIQEGKAIIGKKE